MTELFARKGDAEPLYLDTGMPVMDAFPGEVPEFRHRRSLEMKPLCAPTPDTGHWEGRHSSGRIAAMESRRPVNRPPLMGIHRAPTEDVRRRFTFRLDLDRHHRFGVLAALRGLSRQKLLTEILDRALAEAEAAGDLPPRGRNFSGSVAGGRGYAV